MAEQSVVLNLSAKDNTWPALSSVDKRLQELYNQAVRVSNWFGKVMPEKFLKNMDSYKQAVYRAQNEITRLSNSLKNTSQSSDAYNVIITRLNHAYERYNVALQESKNYQS